MNAARSGLDGDEKRGRLGRNDWIEAGLEVLSDSGVDAVSIGRLCRHLGVTKGSFYWHFKSREDLLRGVAQSWTDAITSSTRAAGAASTPSGFERIAAFNEATLLAQGAANTAMRAWAAHDPIAVEAVSRVDAAAKALTRQALGEAGLSIGGADAYADLLYYAAMGVLTSNTSNPAEALRDLLEVFRALVSR